MDNELQRRIPTVKYLREIARRRAPRFAYECGDGGAGDDTGIRRNWKALDDIEIVPRYGIMTSLPQVDMELFGHRYAAPIGIAPMGSPGIIWPGADSHLARAAQAHNVPYGLSTVSGLEIENAGKLAPDVFWFQLYRFPNEQHKMGLDLVRRADEAGAKVLVLTLDTPIRTTRTREVLSGIASPFHFTPRMIMEALSCPAYCAAFLQHGIPRFANFTRYFPNASLNEMVPLMRKEMYGAISWEDVALYRDKWKKPLALKGILHPADAEKAVSLGVDAVWVTNHGGRQIEALPAPIDALPGVVSAVKGRAKVIYDSGIRSGEDAVRAIALGADAVFAGKAFLWSLGALGHLGPDHALDLFIDEIRAAMGQIGAKTFEEARASYVRHPGAYDIPLTPAARPGLVKTA
jgi:(S)-mandelate dehydrogenase